jgi:glycosyltransferase involved in cell wall biosynthesis
LNALPTTDQQLGVAIVIPCFRQAHFLSAAIASALNQSTPAAEVIVIDDGLDDEVAAVARNYSAVRLIRQPNRGLSAARNAGLRTATCEKVIFLDADDLLLPNAIEAGWRCFRANPDAAFVYGAFIEVRDGRETSGFVPVSSHTEMIQCNWIGCPAAVMFDRAKLVTLGGFDESLGMCEDWDAYLRLSRIHPFASHRETVARYMKHDANMSNDVAQLRRWIDRVRALEMERGLTRKQRIAWRQGKDIWTRALDPNRRPLPFWRRVANRLRHALP